MFPKEGLKAWLCLYTCAVITDVHLDLVHDLSTLTFLRSFKHFTSRRGVPAKLISDNDKTFCQPLGLFVAYSLIL